MDRTLSGFTSLDPSGYGSYDIKGVLHIPYCCSIFGAPPLDCFVLYPGARSTGSLIPLQRCSQCVLQPQMTGLVVYNLLHYNDKKKSKFFISKIT